MDSDARNSSNTGLLLVMASAGKYLPDLGNSESYPMELMQRNLDWVHVTAYDYYLPRKDHVTHFHAALRGRLDGLLLWVSLINHYLIFSSRAIFFLYPISLVLRKKMSCV
jgi:hypothetical protein